MIEDVKPLPRFIPVIHVTGDEQALRQADIAFSNGAGGVFLIDHKRSWRRLLLSYDIVRKQYPDKWIGLNFLDIGTITAVQAVPKGADALWIDDGGFYPDPKYDELADSGFPYPMAEVYANLASLSGRSPRCESPWKLFSGFEFKYQPPASNLEVAAKWAIRYSDVPTTSGDGTGISADMLKIIKLKGLLGDKPLALASGVTLDNVLNYKAYIDCFMVATGISTSFDRFDADKVKEMSILLS